MESSEQVGRIWLRSNGKILLTPNRRALFRPVIASFPFYSRGLTKLMVPSGNFLKRRSGPAGVPNPTLFAEVAVVDISNGFIPKHLFLLRGMLFFALGSTKRQLCNTLTRKLSGAHAKLVEGMCQGTSFSNRGVSIAKGTR
jgi:hypothetical protein